MPPKPVPIFSQPPTVIPSRPNDSHDLATTLAFVETLDTLPGELTKTFGDLRELDAVLNSTTANVTRKLRALTATLQSINQDVELAHGNLIPRGADRNKHEDIRQLLLEIAEELTRYKIGVEDKVRVSGQACDTLVAHQAHLQALLTNSSVLLASPSMKFIERPKIQGDAAHIRRQRASPTRAAVTNGYGSAYGGSDQENTSQPTRGTNVMAYDADDVTPSKRRRTGKEKNAMGMDTWDLEETLLGRRSPALGKKPVASVAISQAYKEKKIVSKKRNRNSPAESLREHSIHHRLGKHDAMQVGPDLSEHSQTVEDRRAMGSSSHTTSSNHSVPPSAKHSESIRSSNDTNNFLGSVKGYANSAHGKIQLPGRVDSQSNGRREGARPSNSQQMAVMDHDSAEADHDPTPYCYCQKQSYGEMIGCDSDDCRFEWFHLSCLNLAQPPDGTWLCPECEAREQREKRSKSKKNGTGGKVSRKRI